ncbi:Hypothetical protein EPM1_1687 [Stenotrophomonas maltophilia EPM1]|nr:Hypothetical protein EPM1_1687 [Stenotrophomonas maltophilia EPM1]
MIRGQAPCLPSWTEYSSGQGPLWCRKMNPGHADARRSAVPGAVATTCTES